MPDTARVLYAEDEIIIALDTTQLLEEMGYSDIRVAHTLRRARSFAEAEQFDVALLDVNLGGGEMSLDLGRDLIRRGVEVVFATGYNRAEMEVENPDLVFIEKPLNLHSMMAVLGTSRAQAGPSSS